MYNGFLIEDETAIKTLKKDLLEHWSGANVRHAWIGELLEPVVEVWLHPDHAAGARSSVDVSPGRPGEVLGGGPDVSGQKLGEFPLDGAAERLRLPWRRAADFKWDGTARISSEKRIRQMLVSMFDSSSSRWHKESSRFAVSARGRRATTERKGRQDIDVFEALLADRSKWGVVADVTEAGFLGHVSTDSSSSEVAGDSSTDKASLLHHVKTHQLPRESRRKIGQFLGIAAPTAAQVVRRTRVYVRTNDKTRGHVTWTPLKTGTSLEPWIEVAVGSRNVVRLWARVESLQNPCEVWIFFSSRFPHEEKKMMEDHWCS